MNMILNDMGQYVVAIGSPGSIERVKVEYPALIARLNNLYFQSYNCYGHSIDEAIEIIRAAGIKSSLETNSILTASDYSKEPGGSLTKLVMTF